MPQFVDCYFLVESRKPEIILHFLDNFLPENSESTDEYGIPIYSDSPNIIFNNASVLLKYLFEHNDIKYSIYWKNQIPDVPIQHGMVFHTDDGNMIVGISVIGNDPLQDQVLKIYDSLGEFLGSKIGCLTVEEAPPHNSKEFIEFAKERFQP